MSAELPTKILIVDDESELAESLRINFELEGYSAEIALNGRQALELSKNYGFDLALVDMQLPDMMGDQVIENIKAISPGTSFIIMTGFASIESVKTAVGKGDIFAYETKPFDVNHIVAIAKEIHNRKRVEKLLREKEARNQAMFENMINAIAVFEDSEDGSDFIFKDINKTAERIDGLKREETTGKKITEALPGVGECGLFDLMKSVRDTGVPEYLTNVQYRDDRISGWRTFYVFKLLAGEIVLVYEDVTERKKIGDALLESEFQSRKLIETSHDGIMIADHKTDLCVYGNSAMCAMLGFTGDEFKTLSLNDILSPEAGDDLKVKTGETPPNDQFIFHELPFIKKNGDIIYTEASVYRTILGGKECKIGFIRDITAQIEAEKLESERAQRYKDTLDGMSDFIHVCGPDLKIILHNKAFIGLLDYMNIPCSNVIGKGIFELFTFLPEKVGEEYRHVFTTGEIHVVEDLNIVSGRDIFTETRKIPIKEKGIVTQVITVIRDISSRKESERRILDAKKEADLYIDLMTHDLTNFNQTLLGFLDLMALQKNAGEKTLGYIEKSRRQVKKTDSLISKVRSFSLAKSLTPDTLVPVDINQLILDAIMAMKSMYRKKQFTIDYIPANGMIALGSELLESVFINLLENAIKHCSKEEPVIKISISSRDENACWEVRFEDNGPGVPDLMKEKIFDRFLRMGSEKGMGLGLSLVRTILERVGGTVRVDDVLADGAVAGSVFIIQVPKG